MAQYLQIGPHKLLTAAEVKRVVDFLHRRRNLKRKRKDQRWRVMLMIFHLSTFHGLRAKEIAGLQLGDFRKIGDDRKNERPYILLRAETVKGMRGCRYSREVRLTWQPPDIFNDVRQHLDWRRSMGANPDDPFVCSVEPHSLGRRLTRVQVYRWFRKTCKAAGCERDLHVHMGRHTFATMALDQWKLPVNQVQAALGHRSLATTSIYVHALDDPSHDWGDEQRRAG